MTTDRIEKEVEIKAPVSRVWKALTDYKEFSTWFRVNLEGPFIPGETARGNITHPGYEHVVMETPAVLLLHLASLCDRSRPGLFPRDADAR